MIGSMLSFEVYSKYKKTKNIGGNMKNYKLNYYIMVILYIISIFMFIYAVSTNASFDYTEYSFGRSFTTDRDYEISGKGNLVTNNKYKIKSAKVVIIVYDENNIETQRSEEINYKPNMNIEYKIYVTTSMGYPEKILEQVTDVKFDNEIDIIVSIALFVLGTIIAYDIFYKSKKGKNSLTNDLN